MKIEKLTKNKIRITLNKSDFKSKETNFKELLSKNLDLNQLFMEILTKAKSEINFNTDGCKLLIDTFIQNDEIIIFTITKYKNYNQNKKFTKKTNTNKENKKNSTIILNFSSINNFYNFCYSIYSKNNNTIFQLIKKSILYFYKSTYYLIIELNTTNINLDEKNLNKLLLKASEFSIPKNYSNYFQFKLKEHGKIIIKTMQF